MNKRIFSFYFAVAVLATSTAQASGGVIRFRENCLRLLEEAGILNNSIQYVKVKGRTPLQDDFVLVESPSNSRGGELRVYNQTGSRTQNLQTGSCGRSDRKSISDRIRELVNQPTPSNVRRSDQTNQAIRENCNSGYGIDHPRSTGSNERRPAPDGN